MDSQLAELAELLQVTELSAAAQEVSTETRYKGIA